MASGPQKILKQTASKLDLLCSNKDIRTLFLEALEFQNGQAPIWTNTSNGETRRRKHFITHKSLTFSWLVFIEVSNPKAQGSVLLDGKGSCSIPIPLLPADVFQNRKWLRPSNTDSQWHSRDQNSTSPTATLVIFCLSWLFHCLPNPEQPPPPFDPPCWNLEKFV